MERSIQVQAQIRRDAEEHGRALRELQEWGEEMKRREEEERQQQEQEGDAGTQVLAAVAAMAQPGRAIEDGRDDNSGGDYIGANGYYVDDANQRSPMDMASAERQRGNDCYAAARYDDAIKRYTACLVFDPQSAVAYSNRGECSRVDLHSVSLWPIITIVISPYFSFHAIRCSHGPPQEEGLAQGRGRCQLGPRHRCVARQIVPPPIRRPRLSRFDVLSFFVWLKIFRSEVRVRPSTPIFGRSVVASSRLGASRKIFSGRTKTVT